MGEEDDEFHALQFLQMDCVFAPVFACWILHVGCAVGCQKLVSPSVHTLQLAPRSSLASRNTSTFHNPPLNIDLVILAFICLANNCVWFSL